jgi:hypothetical protein
VKRGKIFAATPHRTERLTNILLRAKRYETERANESLKESPQTRQELEAFAGEMCDWATYIFEQPVVKPEFVDQVYLYQFTNGERVAKHLVIDSPDAIAKELSSRWGTPVEHRPVERWKGGTTADLRRTYIDDSGFFGPTDPVVIGHEILQHLLEPYRTVSSHVRQREVHSLDEPFTAEFCRVGRYYHDVEGNPTIYTRVHQSQLLMSSRL